MKCDNGHSPAEVHVCIAIKPDGERMLVHICEHCKKWFAFYKGWKFSNIRVVQGLNKLSKPA